MLGAGDALEIGGARLEVVWPTTDAPIGNDGSLVFRIVFGGRSMLFTGDIEEAGEASLLRLAAERGFALHADVLKVSHHGSRGASSAAFIGSIAPKWAVVSAPRKSPYGHPHAETLRRLRAGGAMVIQTGIDGAVGFVTDGHELVLQRIAESGTQLLPPDFDHGARCDRTKSPGGPK
jgi:competence protein ComEC